MFVQSLFLEFLCYLSCWTFHACASIPSLSCVSYFVEFSSDFLLCRLLFSWRFQHFSCSLLTRFTLFGLFTVATPSPEVFWIAALLVAIWRIKLFTVGCPVSACGPRVCLYHNIYIPNHAMVIWQAVQLTDLYDLNSILPFTISFSSNPQLECNCG